MNNKEKLTEATMMALKGKLEDGNYEDASLYDFTRSWVEDQLDKYLKKVKVGTAGFFLKENGQEEYVADKWVNPYGEFHNFVYLVPVSGKERYEKGAENGHQINAYWLYEDYDIDKLPIKR